METKWGQLNFDGDKIINYIWRKESYVKNNSAVHYLYLGHLNKSISVIAI